jgi:hypothetical protein
MSEILNKSANNNLKLVVILIILTSSVAVLAQSGTFNQNAKIQHPCLILKKNDIPAIRNGISKNATLLNSFQISKCLADKAIEAGIKVPVPKDPGGGYTHEQHRQNYASMYNAALVYQLTGDEKYAVFVRDMLLEYAKLYPVLGLHPERKGTGPGKLFWQGLNDCVWLVYAIQAYDCVFDFISEDQRKEIENQLFRKIVHFFTSEDSYTFNRIHNHGTWAVAGVGMTGLVLGDKKFTDMALYSTRLDSTGGFIRQIDDLFSPDGYYSEGPYYQRYAILPFIIFAKALDNNNPDLKIFQYKNSVLTKSVSTLLQLTNSNGRFFPINDALKEKSLDTPELTFATNIAFGLTGDKELLDVIKEMGQVMLSSDGLNAANMIETNQVAEFKRKSILLHDGVDGKQGGLAILRSGEGNDQSSVLFKFTTQGMGHGHFDRLSFLFYDNGNEIFTDYGSVRFLNVESKDGGRYLPENKTWACQTVAHNTVVVNEQSQFNAKVDVSELSHPDLLFADLSNKNCQVVAAADSNSYKGIILQRTLTYILIYGKQFLIDLFRVENKAQAVYDLPFYYSGEIMSANINYQKEIISKKVLGSQSGYQHLWADGKSSSIDKVASITLRNGNRFYTLSFTGNKQTDVLFTSLGANDQMFNLRNESGIIVRQNQTAGHAFLSVIEAHGNYDPASEAVSRSAGSVKNLELLSSDKECSLIKVTLIDGEIVRLALSHQPDNEMNHTIKIGSEEIRWKGNFKLITDKNN